MTDSQLLTIVVSTVACNIAILSGFAAILNTNVNKRIDDLRTLINERFDRFEKTYDEKYKELDRRVSQLERKAS